MFSTGVGNTDAALIMGTGKIWLKVPETMRFVFEGSLPPYLMAKDLILAVIGDIGCDGATYRAMEFDGEAVYGLSMQERMTLTNMAIEAGGKNGIIAPDDTTLGLRAEPDGCPLRGCLRRRGCPLPFRVQLRRVHHGTGSRQASQARQQGRGDGGGRHEARPGLRGQLHGGKLEDFEAAARILKGQEVAVDTFIVPATTEIGRALHTSTVDGVSLHDIFERAGCKMGRASCAACLGGPPDTFGPQQRSRGGDLHHQSEFSGAHGIEAGIRLPCLLH